MKFVASDRMKKHEGEYVDLKNNNKRKDCPKDWLNELPTLTNAQN